MKRLAWSAVWERMAARERRIVAWGALVVLLAGVWMLGVAPALRTLRAAPAQLELLDSQQQSMQALAAQARAIQSRPPLARDEAIRQLESSVQQRLGASAQLVIAGERATVTLKGAAPEALAQWLGQARANARVLPRQTGLARGPGGWEGTVVLDLPPPA